MAPRNKYSREEMIETAVRVVRQKGIDAQTADRYFRDMWLVVHSLATLVVTGGCPYAEEEMEHILTGFSVSLCKSIKEIPGFVENNYDCDTIFREVI